VIAVNIFVPKPEPFPAPYRFQDDGLIIGCFAFKCGEFVGLGT
jgi:hypothetical protein